MEDSLDLARYLLIFRRWLWLIAICTLLAGAVAYVVSISMTPVYEATATLITEQSGNPFDSFTSWAIRNAQWEPLTYAKLLPLVTQATATKLGLEKIDPASISVDVETETRVVVLRVRDTDPVRATQIANTIPMVFADYVQSLQQDRYTEAKEALSEELERLETDIDATQSRIEAIGEATTVAQQTEMTRLEETLAQQRYSYGQLLTAYEQVRMSEAQAQGTLLLFQEATVPQRPVLPKIGLNTLLAAAAGMLLAVGAAFLFEHLDDTIKTSDDVKKALGLVTLAAIPQIEGDGENKLVVVEQPFSPSAEIFRKLRTNIGFSGLDRPLRTLLVTSPSPSEGKSTAITNLAATMAQAGLKVIALDADLRRPRLHVLLNLSPYGGLSKSLLDGRVDGHIQPVREVEGLMLLAAGEKPPDPAEALGSQRMRQLLAELTEQADIVLVDSPPILPVTDAAVLAQAVDGVLLLIDSGSTRRQIAQRAVEELNQVGANLIGVVLNRVSARTGGYYHHYHAYYGGDEGKKPRHRLKKGLLALLRPASKQKQERVQNKPNSSER